MRLKRNMVKLLAPVLATVIALSQPVTVSALTPLTIDNFDSARYAADYPDLAAVFGLDHNLLWAHYENFGSKEGRRVYTTSGDEGYIFTKETFDFIRYADENPDLKALYGYNREALWTHFMNHGAGEGRRAYSKTDSAGIDVSSYQGEINWNAVKSAGIDYAVIRLGYRGSETARIVRDARFEQNIRGAINAGIRVGIYFVTQAVNEAEAREEANYCLNAVAGYGLAMPIFVDVEGSGGRGDKIDRGTRTQCIKAFCQTVTAGGRLAGVYASKKWMTDNIDMSQLTQYSIWLAQYYKEKTWTQTRVDAWQFTSSGSVPGIAGRVDVNHIYVRW